MGGSSKQKNTTDQTTTTTLPGNQQTNVDTLLQGALDYYNSGGRSFFPGDTVADFNPYQTQGQNQLLDFAGGTGQNLADQAIAGNQFFMDPNNILNLDNIPGYRDSQDATARAYTQNLTENILPSVRGGATSAGQFGGSASGIGQALSVDRSSQALADAQTRQDLGAYSQGLSAFNQAQNRAPSLFALGAQPGTITAGIGDANQNQQQREIDADVLRHNFGENEPLNLLSMLQQATGNAGQYGGTVDSSGTSTTTGGGSSPINQALGLGTIGASLYGGGGGSGGKGGATGGGGGGKGGSTSSTTGGGGIGGMFG